MSLRIFQALVVFANRRGFRMLPLVIAYTACCTLTSGTTHLWAQETPSRVLTYIPAQKGRKAHVVFTPPPRDFTVHKDFRLRTPQGTVVVHCEPMHPANPRYTWASEISYPLYESLYYFRSPRSLPVYLLYNYGGNAAPAGGASSVHTVRVNGKVLYGGRDENFVGPDGKVMYDASRQGLSRLTPIVMTGKWNKVALIISNSGGE